MGLTPRKIGRVCKAPPFLMSEYTCAIKSTVGKSLFYHKTAVGSKVTLSLQSSIVWRKKTYPDNTNSIRLKQIKVLATILEHRQILLLAFTSVLIRKHLKSNDRIEPANNLCQGKRDLPKGEN